MVKVYPFAAVCPRKEVADKIASVPYDVVNAEEAREIVEENPLSFMSVVRSEATLPGVSPDDDRVYARAKQNLNAMVKDGLLVSDNEPGMYIYRIKQGGSLYTGLVTDLSVDDYLENKIKKHEQTRYEKEEDRTRHIDTTNANTGLVVLLYRDQEEIFSYIESLIPEGEPDMTVKTASGVVHEIFRVTDKDALAHIEALFAGVDSLYIADGHHRAKSAVNVAERRRDAGTITPEAERFMGILFADQRVKVHGYSRMVTDLGDYTPESFIEALKEHFEIKPYGNIDHTVFRVPPLHEAKKPVHVMHMYLGGVWYELTCPLKNPDDRIASLDVSVLQKTVLEGMLGITDPRGDPRLQYLGGARPLADLEIKVDSGAFVVAFSMQPVDVRNVLSIADEGGIMPPKSTWFEPKLLSGLTIHMLD